MPETLPSTQRPNHDPRANSGGRIYIAPQYSVSGLEAPCSLIDRERKSDG